MAIIGSRSPARAGLTCAQTKPPLPALASKWGLYIAAARVTTSRISASALASPVTLVASTASISAAHAARFLTSATLVRNGLVVTPTAPRSSPS